MCVKERERERAREDWWSQLTGSRSIKKYDMLSVHGTRQREKTEREKAALSLSPIPH